MNDVLHDFRGVAHPTPKVASTWTTDSASDNTSSKTGATALLVLTLREREREREREGESTYELIIFILFVRKRG